MLRYKNNSINTKSIWVPTRTKTSKELSKITLSQASWRRLWWWSQREQKTHFPRPTDLGLLACRPWMLLLQSTLLSSSGCALRSSIYKVFDQAEDAHQKRSHTSASAYPNCKQPEQTVCVRCKRVYYILYIIYTLIQYINICHVLLAWWFWYQLRLGLAGIPQCQCKLEGLEQLQNGISFAWFCSSPSSLILILRLDQIRQLHHRKCIIHTLCIASMFSHQWIELGNPVFDRHQAISQFTHRRHGWPWMVDRGWHILTLIG